MTGTIKESKQYCVVRLSHDKLPGQTVGPQDGLIHLFEHHYDAKLGGFWYGVVEVACEANDALITALEPMEEVRIVITLPDGRTGMARYTRTHMSGSGDGVLNFRLAVIGAVALGSVKL